MRWLYVVCLVAIQAMAPVAWAQDKPQAKNPVGLGVIRLADDHPGCDCEVCECPDPEICRTKSCKKRYVVVFTTSGCAPCEKQKATFKALAKAGYLVFEAADPRAAEHYGVRAFPTVLLMDEGKVVKRWDGVTPYGELAKELKVAAKPDKPEPKKPSKPSFDLG